MTDLALPGSASGVRPDPARANRARPPINDIPGWFFWLDRQLFATLLHAQQDRPAGDLVELGTYLGKSAVLIGDHLRAGERFLAVDLFGRTDLLDDAQAPNRREVQASYSRLTRDQFERNYLAFHPELPTVVEGPSSVIMDHVGDGTVRFVHVDASHLYDHVRLDAEHARRMLQPGGLVVFDDYRSEHTPGVSAAVWEAVFAHGLIPVALTGTKLYGVFSDPQPYRDALGELLTADDRIWSEVQGIAGVPVRRLRLRQQPATRSERDDDRLARLLAGRVEQVLRADGGRRGGELRRVVRDEVDRASTLRRLQRWLRRHRR